MLLLLVQLLSVILALLGGGGSLVLSVEERADLRLVAAGAVAVDALVLVGVVQPLHCGVALVAEQALGAHLPALVRAHDLAVLRRVLKDLRRPAEVPHVVGVEAGLRVMGLLPVRAPARLVPKHVESESFP